MITWNLRVMQPRSSDSENLLSSRRDASQTVDWKHQQMAFTAYFRLSGVMDWIPLQVIKASMRYKFTSLMFLEKEKIAMSLFWIKEVEKEGHSCHINPFFLTEQQLHCCWPLTEVHNGSKKISSGQSDVLGTLHIHYFKLRCDWCLTEVENPQSTDILELTSVFFPTE